MAGQRYSPDFEVDGEEKLMANLARAIRQIEDGSGKALEKVATQITNQAKMFSPVDTGRLRSSLGYEMGKDSRGVFALVGTLVEYAIHVEYGTWAMAAQPFLRPAIHRVAAEMLGIAAPVIRHNVPALRR